MLFPSQLPRQITIEFTNDTGLSVEIIGFFMDQLNVQKGDWIFLLEMDNMLTLTSQVMVRGPSACNCVVGIPSTSQKHVARSFADNCVSNIKDISILPFIVFTWVLALR